MQHSGMQAGAGWGRTPVFSRGNVFPSVGNGAGTAILGSSRWGSRAGSQIQALPAFLQEELLARCSKAEAGRVKVPSKPPGLQHPGSAHQSGKLVNPEGTEQPGFAARLCFQPRLSCWDEPKAVAALRPQSQISHQSP